MAKGRKPKVRNNPEPSMRAGFVLAVDIVGVSTRKSGSAMNSLVNLAQSCPTYQRAISAGTVTRLPNVTGYALAFTDDPTAPLRCAVELRALALRNGLSIRSAVHIGPISPVRADIAGNQTVAGEGVSNAFQALIGCAANEIVVTQRAHEFIRESPKHAESFDEPETIDVEQGAHLTILRYRDGSSRPDPLAQFVGRATVLRDRAAKRGVPAAGVRVIAQRLKMLRGETLLALAMMPISLGLHYGFEHSSAGVTLRREGYERLIAQMPAADGPSPVTVVDIGTKFDQPGTETTDLEKLRALVKEIARHQPKAIGIDIDFGFHSEPNNEGLGRYLDEDETVLRLARTLTDSGLPVFVAVYEHLEFETKDELLGARFSDLVTHPLRPDDALHGQVLMIGDLHIHNHVIPSMPGKFAQYANLERPPGWLDFLVRRETALADVFRRRKLASLPGQLVGPEYLLNVTTLDRVKAARVVASPAAPMLPLNEAQDMIAERLVLIGATNGPDFFVMPVTGERVSGPYYHAMAAVTLIEAPLYEFNTPVALGLALLAGAIVMLVAQLALRRNITRPTMPNHERWTSWATASTVVLLVLLGGWLATACRIVWTEYLLTAILVAFHPALHRWVEGLVTRRAGGHGERT